MGDFEIKDFYTRMNKELKRQGKTQVELCKSCNMSVGSLRTRISQNNAPNIFDAYKIADFLNVSLEYLVSGHETQAQSVELEKAKTALHEIMLICQNTTRTL